MEKITLDFTGIPEEDAVKILQKAQSDIQYISSGMRDRHKYKEELEKELQAWGREFGKQLKDVGIDHKNTSYSAWEYGRLSWTISIPYVLSRTEFLTKEDFRVRIIDYNKRGIDDNHFKVVGEYKTPELVIEALIKEGMFKPKGE